MKKALSLVLSILLTFSMAVSALAVSFPDVDSNYSWAKDAIEEAAVTEPVAEIAQDEVIE